MPKIKALYVLQCREYVIEHHGDEGLARVRDAMEPSAWEQAYSPTLLATDWLDMAVGVEHGRAYDRAYPGARPWDGTTRMITDLVAKHYNGLYRATLGTATSPMAMLEKSSRLWSRFYDVGESQIVRHGPTNVTKRIVGCVGLSPDHDRLLMPYYAELLRQAGAKDVIARHASCDVVSGCCEIALQWREVDM